VGVFVWDLIQQPRKVTELRDAICAEYDIEPARAESDLLALLQQLAEKQLLEIRTEAVA
jgi:hypothetical protein